MSQISVEIGDFLTKGGPSIIPIGDENAIGFEEIINDVFNETPRYWLELDSEITNYFLSDVIDLNELADLMSLVVSDGGDGWLVPEGVTREGLGKFNGPDAQFSTPSPAPRARLPVPK